MRWTRSVVGDVVLAAALVVVGVLGTVGAGLRTGADRPVDALGLALVVAAASTLAVRRRWPLATLAVVALLTAAYLAVGYPFGPVLLVFAVAVYTVARMVPLHRSVPASLAALVVLLAHLLIDQAAPEQAGPEQAALDQAALSGLLGVIPAAAWVAVPFAVGVTVRSTAESAARARAEDLRRHVDEERLRVAQEVHDVVGHGLAAIKMQADVALHVRDRNPRQAETALAAISHASAEALEDLRSTLGVLGRTQDGSAGRVPAPGLDRVDDLCARMREAGVQVSFRTLGEPRAVPAAADLAAYRVMQESLTNVLRHSATRTAEVTLGYEEGAVTVTVSNPSPSTTTPNPHGFGIPGMRRRVESLGGLLTVEPERDGRFVVRARIPAGAGTP